MLTKIVFILVLKIISVFSAVTNEPCLNVLTYDDNDSETTDSQHYYVNVILKPKYDYETIYVRIEMSEPIELLGNDMGVVTSKDNKIFNIVIVNKNNHVFRIKKDSETSIRIFISLGKGKSSIVQSIKLNGDEICKSDSLMRPNPNSLEPKSPPTESPTVLEWTPPIKQKSLLKPLKLAATSRRYISNEIDDVKCGLPSRKLTPKIIDGDITELGQWPWHVALFKSDKTAGLSYICGGSLISKNFVVTAAHCVEVPAEHLFVSLGRYRLNEWSHEGIQGYGVREVIIDSNYNRKNLFHDIALVKLQNSVKYTDFVRPVCLWEGSDVLNEVVGKQGKVAGWGRTSIQTSVSDLLMMTDMPIISHDDCLSRQRKSNLQSYFNEYTNDKSYCAGYANGTKSVCNGDSGGGMVFPIPGTVPLRWQLRGLVSSSTHRNDSTDFCNPNDYMLFTDVARHAAFIKETINKI